MTAASHPHRVAVLGVVFVGGLLAVPSQPARGEADAPASAASSLPSDPVERQAELIKLAPVVPEGARELADRASSLMAAGKYDQATVLYEEMARRHPDSMYAWSNLAVVRYKLKQYDEAFLAVNKGLVLNPTDPFCHWLAGNIYLDTGKLDKALIALMQANELAPRDPRAATALGVVMARLGDFKQAESTLRRAIALKPTHGEAHINLAWVYALQKPPKPGLARSHYSKARDLGRPADNALEARLE